MAAAPLLTSLPATFNAIPDTTPSNDPAVIIPATTKSPAGLKVAPTAVGCPILIPLLAVISPVESTFVTSSYVRVPPIDTSPPNVAPTATIPP